MHKVCGYSGWHSNFQIAPESLSQVSAFESRSTSPGSLSPPSSPEQDPATPLQFPLPKNPGLVNALPDLEELYEERRVQSCSITLPPGLGSDYIAPMAGDNMMTSFTVAATAKYFNDLHVAAAQRGAMTIGCQGNTPSKTNVHAPALSLAGVLARVGTPDAATAGSKGHHMGNCKPCAFYHTKGCGSGADCVFCHLCPEGEKKRRQKEKIATRRSRGSTGWDLRL